MITLDKAAERASQFVELPSSMETLRRWSRNNVISGKVDEVYHGGDIGREVFYKDKIIYEIVIAARLKKAGWKLEEVAYWRQRLEKRILEYTEKGFEKVKGMNKISRPFNERHKEFIKEKEAEIKDINKNFNDIYIKKITNINIKDLQKDIKELKKDQERLEKSSEYMKEVEKCIEDIGIKDLKKAN
jgi:hypothetical protein